MARNLGFRFSLVSYNILSQTVLNGHLHLYTSCNPHDLEWPKRGHRIVSELLHDAADIICLQEVENEHLQSLYRPKLARYGYECLYKKRTGTKVDGCAIFYKSELFHLQKCKGIEFNRTDLNNILNLDNIGIIAVLKPKLKSISETAQLVVANTHLLFNPNRDDIRLAQVKLFLSELEEISFEHEDNIKNERSHHPTILCGDFNSVPNSVVERYITKNMRSSINTNINQETRDTDNHDKVQLPVEDENLDHPFQFKSVYPTHDRDGRPYVTTFGDAFCDYIFYTPELRLESYRELLREEEFKKIEPVPNSEFPSDHSSLKAKFKI